jgi:hypothetical protein
MLMVWKFLLFLLDSFEDSIRLLQVLLPLHSPVLFRDSLLALRRNSVDWNDAGQVLEVVSRIGTHLTDPNECQFGDQLIMDL